MTNKNNESSQGDGGAPAQGGAPTNGGAPAHPPPVGQQHGPPEHMSSRGANTIFKSGPLFISSKGIGWTSWKKRWFILTRTSLVFFRSDPSAIPQKGSEVNLTLGGIDLNNSGSVVAKPDKKLLTVLFPDGRDGRAFTLKAETLEDLYEWKTALETALLQAPPAASVVGQNGILKSDQAESADTASEKSKDKQPVKSIVLGRPILLALEDVDGTPSFLEKALRFIEEHGVRVEGILRQAADVEDVECRIREFEHGKTDLSPDEDAHVIADCLKYVLRELPSSPVPASCCNALLEARRTDRGGRVNAMRAAICDTFPEPNRRLLQRILMMMQIVASHKTENRMSSSAVSACMAPLLLRPLLAGDCEIETDFDVGADSSLQLMQAAAAANHAQAIVITLLEEYENIFGEGTISPGLYSEEESGSGSEGATDDEESYEDDGLEESDAYTDDASSGSCVESSDSRDNDLDENKDSSTDLKVPETGNELGVSTKESSRNDDDHRSGIILNQSENDTATQANVSAESFRDVSKEKSSEHELRSSGPNPSMQKASTISNGPANVTRRPTILGRTAAKKNLSMESIDCPLEEEAEVEKLEATKSELENKLADEVKGNDFLQASLERRKKALHERRIALEKDVARLREQLQKERDKRTALETGLNTSQGSLNIPDTIDEKMKVELEEIVQAEADVMNLTQKIGDLGSQLNQQLEKNHGSTGDSRNQLQQMSTKTKDMQRESEAAVSSHDHERSRSKDTVLDGAIETENEKKRESTSSGSKKSQNLESICSNSSKLSSTGSSKKSSSKVEGSNSTASALTKLTTRLNFLKERRSQMSYDLQNIDKGQGGRGQTHAERSKGSESAQSLQTQGSEVQSVSNAESGGESESLQSLQNLDRGVGREGQSLQSLKKTRKSSNSLLQNADEDKKPESQHSHTLDRGRSEGHVSYDAEKSRGQRRKTPRTLSR